MSNPIQGIPSVGQGAFPPQSEWDEASKRRGELFQQIMDQLKLGQVVGKDGAAAAVTHHAIAGQNADGSPTMYQQAVTPPSNNETQQLIGAAETYGIKDAANMPPMVLKSIINARRLGMQQQAGPASDLKKINDGMASLGMGIINEPLKVAERLPLVGDLIAKNKWIQATEQSIGRANEIIQSSNTPEGAKNADTSMGIGAMVGYTLPFEGALRLAGLAGKVGFIGANASRLSPITRAAVKMGTAEGILDVGRSDISAEQKMVQVGMAAGGGAAFAYVGEAIPTLFNKIKGWFPSGKAILAGDRPPVGDGNIPPRGPGPTEDAQWWFEHDDPSIPMGQKLLALHPEMAQEVTQAADSRVGQTIPNQTIRMLPSGAPEGPTDLGVVGPSSPLFGPPGSEVAPRSGGPLVGPQREQLIQDFGNYLSQVHANAVAKNPARKFSLMADMTEPKTRAALVDLHQAGVPPNLAANFVDELAFTRDVGYAEAMPVPGTPARLTNIPAQARTQLPLSLYEASPQEKANYINGLIVAKKAAAQSAGQLTKQATLMESGNINQLLKASQITNADVVQTALHRSPGAINIIQDVGDLGRTIPETISRAGGTVPQFRVLSRNGRTDLMVSDGPMMSDAQAAQYEQHGIFTGQEATIDGIHVSVVKPGLGQTWVRETGGKHDFLAPTQYILPGNGSIPEMGATYNASDLYGELQDYTEGQMTKVQKSMGIAEPLDWLSQETATQLPRFIDEFLARQKLDAPAVKQSLISYFEQRRMSDFKALAPDEFKNLNQIQSELGQALISKPKESIPIEDIAATKGFTYRQYPDGVGGTLEDKLSTLNFPAKSEEEALEFLKSFNREVPDYSPESHVPVELGQAGPGASHPGNQSAPVWQGHEEIHTSAKRQLRRNINDIEYCIECANIPREELIRPPARGVPDFALGEQNRENIGRDETLSGQIPPDQGNPPLNPSYFPSSGGGAPPGTVPPRGAPNAASPSGGGGAQPPRGARMGGGAAPPNPPPPSAGGGLGGQFGGKVPAQYYQTMQLLDSNWLRWMDPFRTMTLKLEKALKADGITEGTLWADSDKLRTAMTKKHNEEHPWMNEASDILNEFRHKFLRKGTVMQIQSMTNPIGKQAAMAASDYRPGEMDSQNKLGDFLNRFFSDHLDLKNAQGVSYVDPSLSPQVYRYLNEVRARQANPAILDPITDVNGTLPKGLEFVQNAVRNSNFQIKQMDARTFTTSLVRAGMWERHMQQPWTDMSDKWSDPRIPEKLRKIVEPWLQIVKTGVNQEHDIAIQGIRHVLNRYGMPVTDGEVHGFWNSVFSNAYRASLGGRPDVILRDSISPFLSGVQIGFKPIVSSYSDFLSGGKIRDTMYQRAVKGGWLEEGMVRVPNADVFEKPIQTAGQSAVPQSISARREAFAQVGDALYDLVPKPLRSGIQGTKLDPLLLYTHLNEMNRIIAGDAGWRVATDALDTYQKGLRSSVSQAGANAQTVHKQLLSELIDKSQADTYLKPIQDQFKQLVGDAHYEDAANLLGRESANSQFLYGAKEASIGIRSAGTVGRIGMMYGSFTNQYIARMRGMVASEIPTHKIAAMLARYGTVTGILGAASAYTGWNFSKWMWHNSLGFGGGPGANVVSDLFQAGTGKINELSGQNLSPQQRDALARVSRVSLGDIPGSIATSVFPYSSTIRTAGDIYTSATGMNPVEATARRVITGQQGLGPDFKQWLDNQQIRVTPQQLQQSGQFNIPVGPPNPGAGAR